MKRFSPGFCLFWERDDDQSWELVPVCATQPQPHPPMTNSVINPQKQLLVLNPWPLSFASPIGMKMELVIIWLKILGQVKWKLMCSLICFYFVLQNIIFSADLIKLVENYPIVVRIWATDQRDIQYFYPGRRICMYSQHYTRPLSIPFLFPTSEISQPSRLG